MGTAIKHPEQDRVKPSFVIFDIRSLWRPGLTFRSNCGPILYHFPRHGELSTENHEILFAKPDRTAFSEKKTRYSEATVSPTPLRWCDSLTDRQTHRRTDRRIFYIAICIAAHCRRAIIMCYTVMSSLERKPCCSKKTARCRDISTPTPFRNGISEWSAWSKDHTLHLELAVLYN